MWDTPEGRGIPFAKGAWGGGLGVEGVHWPDTGAMRPGNRPTDGQYALGKDPTNAL